MKTTAILFNTDDAIEIMMDIMNNDVTARQAVLAFLGEKLAACSDDDFDTI